MVVIDEYSRYPEVEIISSVSGSSVIPRLDTMFARWGIPNNVKSDNGAPFMGGEFKEFAEDFGFKHSKIMPEHPEANGEVERFMRTLNRMIRASSAARLNWRTRLPTFLRIYRSTPHSSTKVSPFEALTNRKMNCGLPCPTLPASTPNPSPLHSKIAQNDYMSKTKMCEYTDAKRRTKPCHMKPGDTVLVKQKRQNKLTPPFSPDPYEITARKGSMVTAQRGNHTITRNSSHFKVMRESAPPPSTPRQAEESDTPPSDTGQLPPSPASVPTQMSAPLQTSAQMSAPLQTSSSMSAPLQTSAQMSAPLQDALRRSSRTKQPPVKLKDYTT